MLLLGSNFATGGCNMAKAAEIMVRDVVVVRPDDRVADIVNLFVQRGVTCAVVLDENGTVAGIVTDGDIMAAVRHRRPIIIDVFSFFWAIEDEGNLSLKLKELLMKKAKEIMTKDVITVREDAEAIEIARLMTEYKIKQIPVVRDNILTGIVRRHDIVKAVAQTAKDLPAEL